MKAAVCNAYGGPDVVQIVDVAAPIAAPNELLIRIRATTVSVGDARIRGSNFPSGFGLLGRAFLGVRRPRTSILGTELAGVVEATGARVTRFKTGDLVFAFAGIGMGCHAEFRTVREDGAIEHMPTAFTFEDAAAIAFGGTTALHFLRTVGKVQRGERVLINGAAGAVGSAAVQLARHFGAHVTGVCSAANVQLVRSLGADAVIDYAAVDFAKTGNRWDIIFDAVGNASFARCRKCLNPGGRLLLLASGLGDLAKTPFQTLSSGLKIAGGMAPERAEDVAELKALCDAGVYKPVIDSRYPLDQIAAAHGRVDSGHKRGSVVVTIGDGGIELA